MRTIIAALTLLLLSGASCVQRVERAPVEPTLPVTPSEFPRVLRFVAVPRIVHPGERVELVWNTRNVSEVVLEAAPDPKADIRADFQELGIFPASGTLDVYPKESTNYVMTCGNEKIGCSSASVHVRVK